MKINAAVVSSVVVLAGLLLSVSNGCGDDDDETSSRAARKGEACESTRDCAGGLSCLPNGSRGGVCVVGIFNVATTTKECAITQCQVAADCCDTPSSSCPSLKENCDEQDAGAESAACKQYEALCVCNTNKRDCEAGKCITKCIDDETCTKNGQGSKCLGGKCADCAVTEDCTKRNPEYTCISGECKPPCQTDGDCPGFERCSAGKCIESGCHTTRECVAATRNVEATCGTDGKCIVPCQTDLECGNPKGYSFFSCVAGQCLYVGCDSDKDCRLFYTGDDSENGTSSGTSGGTTSGGTSSSGGSLLGDKTHIVCREKATPGATTKPAQ